MENRGHRLLIEAMGKIAELLEKDEVVEVYCNSQDEHVWVEYSGKGRVKSDLLISADDRRKLIQTVASFSKIVANVENPIITAELPKYGYRFEGSLPEITRLPSFNIRKPAKMVYSISDYVNNGIMSSQQAEIISIAVKRKLNILISGGTGSGKTTLCNAVLKQIARMGDRLIILEDTREIQCEADDYESLKTSDEIDMRALLKTTLRRRPDRIIVGEVRDGAAFDMLKAWNTGHPGGLCTTHANDAAESLKRIASLAMEAASRMPAGMIGRLVASAVNLVIFISRVNKTEVGQQTSGRKVRQVALVSGYDVEKDEYLLVTDEQQALTILREEYGNAT